VFVAGVNVLFAPDDNAALMIPTDVVARRYRLIEPLGWGGVAIVFLARDEHLGRHVAIKQLHADGPTELAPRFRQEARLGALLNHSNIVSVFDAVACERGLLIVMEYVEGPTLASALASGRLSPGRAIKVLSGMAQALDYAHAHGVLHRDVKPGNVLLGRQGQVKLADLGVATVAGSSASDGSTVVGTPAYMAPEQLRGARGGASADIYALGCVAYEILGGLKARNGQTARTLATNGTVEHPPDLRNAWPRAPRPAVRAVEKAMSFEPINRPVSANEFIQELLAGFDTRVATSKPQRPKLLPTARKRVRRRRSGSELGRRPRIPAELAALILVLMACIVSFGSGIVAAKSSHNMPVTTSSADQHQSATSS
jgi:eukaryotic-like serine/threonine-protein kinase